MKDIFDLHKWKEKQLFLNEQDDDFTVDAPEDWDTTELRAGSIITPDMWNRNLGPEYSDISDWIDDPTEDQVIDTIWSDDEGRAGVAFTGVKSNIQNIYTLTDFNNLLDPNYKVLINLAEGEEDFDVDAPKEWDVKELNVGDFITPSMINSNDSTHNSITLKNMFQRSKGEIEIVGINNKEFNIDNVTIGYIDDPTGKYKEYVWGLESLNQALDPKIQIVNTNLNESEEDWSVDAPEEWGTTILTVGSILIPDMFKERPSMFDRPDVEDKLQVKEMFISGFMDSVMIELGKVDTPTQKFPKIPSLRTLSRLMNDQLKPEYHFLTSEELKNTLDESEEDDWSVEAPQDWDTIKLKQGSTITPEMVDMSNIPENNLYGWEKKLIGSQEGKIWKLYKEYIELQYKKIDEEGHHYVLMYTIDLLEILKPGYVLVLSDGTVLEKQDLNESVEDFTVTAPDDWNIKELGVGDRITPEMWIPNVETEFIDTWNWETGQDITSVPWEITNIGNLGRHEVTLRNSWGFDEMIFGRITEINKGLKPEYRIVEDLNESEEDEWDVEAPKEWDNTELTVGSTITPEMWKPNAQWMFSSIDVSKPITIGKKLYPGIYLYITDIKGRGTHINAGTLNKYLKRKYRVIDDEALYESDEDEFDVVAPDEWDVKELGVGDEVTWDMFKTEELASYWMDDYDVKIIESIYQDLPNTIVSLTKPNGEFAGGWWLHSVERDLLPQYQIKVPDNMNENEDEFNVEAPDDWNVEELGVGDQVTRDMFKTEELANHWMDDYDVKIIDDILIHSLPNAVLSLVDIDGEYVGGWWLDSINRDLKPEYQIKIPDNMNENEDEWSVEAPDTWNKLDVGDIITPDMWTDEYRLKNNIENPYKIMWIEINGYGEDSVGINDGTSEYGKIWSVDDLNGWLKPEFQIHNSNTLNESDDEWSVEAPKDWDSFDIEIRMSNQYRFYNDENGQSEYLDEVKLIKTNSDELIKYFGNDIPHDSSQIEDLLYDKYFEDDDLMDFINNGQTIEEIPEFFYDRDWDSDWDDVQFDVKIGNTINEVEDEWSVEAPRDWDYQYLSLDDTITPEMWDLNNPELEDYIDDPTEDWKILELYASRVGSDASIFLQSPTGGELGTKMEEINKLLKPGYKIVVNKLNEVDEDEFNVDAPKEWSILEIGDIISPYMFRDDLKLKTSWKTLKEKPYKISGFGKDFSGPYVELIGEDFEINIDWNKLNQDLLKPEYQIVKPDFYMIENEDEFNVEAPDDWNKEYLTAGDIITPSMIKPKLPIDYRFYKNNTKIKKIMPQRHGDGILINTVFVDQDGRDLPFTDDFHWIEEWNHQLIEPYTISPEKNFGSSLNELLDDEDEFNVEAPKEWDTTNLGIGDIIEPFMIEPKAQIDTYITNVPKIVRLMKKYPTEITDIYNEFKGIQLKLPQWSKIPFTMKLSDIQGILKPGYEISKPSTLDEVDEDEFDVDAPKEWDIKVLTTGDILTNEHLGTGGNTAYKIVGFEDNRVKIEKGKILKRKTGDVFILDNMYSTTNIPLSVLQRRLNPGYVIEPPTTKLSDLLEIDDE